MQNIEQNRISYELNENDFTAKITRSLRARDNVFIPKSIEYENREYVITIIGQKAFTTNQYIKSIEFAEDNQIQLIDDHAFSYSSLKSIIIPSSVKRIGIRAFSRCRQLKSFKFAPNSEIEILDDFAFSKDSFELNELPLKITRIGDNCFDECKNVHINDFSIYKYLQIIGKEAFTNDSLETFTVPVNLKKIGEGSFKKCQKLKSFCFQNNSFIDTLEKEAFANTAIEQFSIPTHITKIGEKCFSQCNLLNFLDFSNNKVLKSIEKNAFQNASISKFVIPSTVENIGQGAFNRCYLLNQFDFNNTNLNIIENSLLAHTSITTISIPDSVTRICDYAFYFCQKLRTININKNSKLISIGKCAFSYTKIKKLFIPDGFEFFDQYWNSGMCHFISLNISENNHNFIITKNIVYGKINKNSQDYDDLIYELGQSKEVIIPSHVKRIRDFTFSFSNRLKRLIFEPGSLLQSIGDETFKKCHKLKKVDFTNCKKLETIGKSAFCHSPVRGFLIPSTVKKIGESMCSEHQSIEYLGENVDVMINLLGCYPIIASFPNANAHKFREYLKFGKFVLYVKANSINIEEN